MALLDQYFGFGGRAPQSLEDLFPTVPDPQHNKSALAASIAFGKRNPLVGEPQLPDWGEPGTQVTPPIAEVGMLNRGPLGVGERAPGISADMGDPSGAGMPPSTNDPMASEPLVFKDGVPLPRPKPLIPGDPMPNVPNREVTDASGARVPPGAPLSIAPQGVVQPQAQAAGGGIGGILGNLLKSENAPLLLSLAGGFAGAPSFGTGMRRAFSGAVPAAMQLQKTQTTKTSQAATYRAMIEKGVPPAEAMAATLDPNVMKAVAAKYFETKPLQHIMQKGALGGETPIVFDPNKGRYLDASGNEIKSDAAGSSGPQLLAPGVKFNPELTGEDYKAQYSKEVQSAMDAYMRGDQIPTGNPRMQSIWAQAKLAAQKYGADMGIPVSDALYSAKRNYKNELASGKAGAGLQRVQLQQGLEHLEGVTKSAEALNNKDLWIGPLSSGVNALRGLTTDQRAKVNEMQNKVQMLAGEMGKFFSGSQGGGVHERAATREKFNSVSSPQELAAAIESSLELLEGGLHAREKHRDDILGPDSNVQILTKDDRARIERIREIAHRMKSGTAAPEEKPKAGKASTGVNWSIVQ